MKAFKKTYSLYLSISGESDLAPVYLNVTPKPHSLPSSGAGASRHIPVIGD